MHAITGKPIEKRAVIEIASFCENLIINIIRQSEIELQLLNQQRKIQGIYQKHRIDCECVRSAIKTINPSTNALPSEQTGGMISKQEQNHDKHLKEEDILTEVT